VRDADGRALGRITLAAVLAHGRPGA
jgi:hypothetical protein